MADQLKEIATATIAVSDLTSNQYYDLVTTDASTQYNITAAVLATNTFGTDPNLEVNNFKAAALSTTSIASAIVDVSSTVRLAFPSALTFTKTVLGLGTTSTGWNQANTFKINGNEVNSESTSLSGPSYGQGGLFSTASDGDFFYYYTDGNSVTQLRKRAGGPSGTETNVTTTSYMSVAFDGERYYYWFPNTSTLRKFDIETETTSDITVNSGGQGPNTSYSRLMYCNGYLAWFNTTAVNPSIYQVSTGNRVQLTGTNAISAHSYGYANAKVGFWIDVDSKDVTFFSMVNTSGSIRKVSVSNIGDFSTSAVANSSPATLSSGATSSYSPSLFNTGPIVGATGLNTFLGSTGDGVHEYTWGTTTAIRQVNTYANYTGGCLSFDETVASPTDTDFPATMAVRLSGVEVTL